MSRSFYDDFWHSSVEPTGASKKLKHFRRLVHHNTSPAHCKAIQRQRANGQARLASMRFTRRRKAAIARIKNS